MPNDKLRLTQDWLLIADGERLAAGRLQQLARHRNIMVLDGAYDYVQQRGLPITILLGDFDSISPLSLTQARASHIHVIHTPDQNYTDFEKGIDYLDELKAASITVCSATGQRLQHTLYNLRVLKKYYRTNRPMQLVTTTENIQYIENCTLLITGKISDSVAILGFPHAIATTRGLKYEMRDQTLNFEQYASVSNALLGKTAEISVVGEALVIHEPN